jgi:hypothetical protein
MDSAKISSDFIFSVTVYRLLQLFLKLKMPLLTVAKQRLPARIKPLSDKYSKRHFVACERSAKNGE